MDTSISTDRIHILKKDLLPKTGEEYALVLLLQAHIPQILSLQENIFSHLSPEEQSFLLKKDRGFFETHFKNGNAVIGIVHDGQLIGQSIILHPTPALPKSGMVDMALDAPADALTVLQGVIVHPDYRGNRLMTAMVDVWLSLAKEQGRTHALAETAIGNIYSWAVFLKEGLQIHSMGVDPDDGTQVYNLHARVTPLLRKRLKPAFNKASAKESIKCPRMDIEKQKNILDTGYKGVKYDAASELLEFRPCKKKAAKPPPALP